MSLVKKLSLFFLFVLITSFFFPDGDSFNSSKTVTHDKHDEYDKYDLDVLELNLDDDSEDDDEEDDDDENEHKNSLYEAIKKKCKKDDSTEKYSVTPTRNPFLVLSFMFDGLSRWIFGDSSPLKDDPVATTALGTMTQAFSVAAGAVGNQIKQENNKNNRSECSGYANKDEEISDLTEKIRDSFEKKGVKLTLQDDEFLKNLTRLVEINDSDDSK